LTRTVERDTALLQLRGVTAARPVAPSLSLCSRFPAASAPARPRGRVALTRDRRRRTVSADREKSQRRR
jgi:hypothetical protein